MCIFSRLLTDLKNLLQTSSQSQWLTWSFIEVDSEYLAAQRKQAKQTCLLINK